jgi:Ni,Fe-hydrogenase III small subunit
MSTHRMQPFYSEGLVQSAGLYGIALENLWLALIKHPSDADRNTLSGRNLSRDLVEYPPTDPAIRRSRAVVFRHLDCGSCNGCELALQRSLNPVFDFEKYNLKFEASPRHAYALAMTGPYVHNLLEPARRTRFAMPLEAIVAVGDCAVNGGVFKDSYTLAHRDDALERVILMRIEGCPPTPQMLLTHFLELSSELDKLQWKSDQ